jgi:antitoxin ParD1/3/4
MTLTLDLATEQLLQQELANGRYREPSELIAHALDLVEAEREDTPGHREYLIDRLQQSIAQADRGEGISGEKLRARFQARKAAAA